MTSVHLKPFHVPIRALGENFNPALIFDRSAVVNYIIVIIIVLGEHFLTWTKSKKAKRYITAASIRTKMGVIDSSKKATVAAHWQIHLSGNEHGTLLVVFEHDPKKKQQ